MFINHDWTREQREQFKRLRTMRKQAIDDGHEAIIKNGQLLVDVIPTLHVLILLQNRMYAGVATVFLFVFGILMVFP